MNESRRQGERRARIEASSQFRGGRFVNTHGVGPGLKGSPWPLLSEFVFHRVSRTPPGPLPLLDPTIGWNRPVESGLRTTWLGHSTVRIELDGRTILTDPVWGERASPSSMAGPRRFHAAPIAIDKLPTPDVVLLSHDHYDHLCRDSIRSLARRNVPIVTSLGVGRHLETFGVPGELIHELDWHETYEAPGSELRITATPAQHFSGRGVSDRNTTLWSSWVISGPRHRVFFSGDTGLTDEFIEIGRRYGPFDLVMLEVGAFHPAWGDIHLGPDNALEAFRMLGGGTLLPVHWGTFNLALHAWDEPAERLYTESERRGVRLMTPRLGEVLEPAHVEVATPWWRSVADRSRG